ncbi:MAG: hypothetical protein U1G07_11810 [Verrucomicrobiota bacterium]
MLSVASQTEIPAAELASASASRRYIPLAVWLLTLATLICVPFKVISYGYLPQDDALRHAAKAVSQREWSDILVVRDELKMDHNPGWHWLLARVHQTLQADTDTLVVMAVIGLFAAALILPIFAMERPEAWAGALLVCTVACPAIPYRVLLGRPLAVSIAVTLAVLALWTRRGRTQPSLKLMLFTTVLLALSAWIHGSWYLFALVVAAFFLSGRTQAALALAGCWMLGSFLGASLTGHPFAFLANAVRIGRSCFNDAPLQRMLVSEFLPSGGSVFTVMTVAAMLMWRRMSGHWTPESLRHPAFILVVLGWLLGLRVIRFEADWAAPALLLWIAFELQDHCKRHLPLDSMRRVVIGAGLCAALFFAATADENSRWSRALDTEYLSAADPEMAPWLPEKGGIVYSADMTIFYQTFFRNPHGQWRYILGFEPTFMPADDLRIYRNIQRNFGAYEAFQPWVHKMRPEDRLILRSASSAAPNIPQLEWHYTARELWVGRKPRIKATGVSDGTPPNISATAQADGSAG